MASYLPGRGRRVSLEGVMGQTGGPVTPKREAWVRRVVAPVRRMQSLGILAS